MTLVGGVILAWIALESGRAQTAVTAPPAAVSPAAADAPAVTTELPSAPAPSGTAMPALGGAPQPMSGAAIPATGGATPQ
jgi:hypothetical protein